MLQLNSQLSWLAKGGDGHRWDGTRPAAGKVRERKRWGGWWRWCWRDGGQNRGLAGVLRVRRGGGGGAMREECGTLWPASHNSQAVTIHIAKHHKTLTDFFQSHWPKNVPGYPWALASSVFSMRRSSSPAGPLEFDHSLSQNQPAPLLSSSYSVNKILEVLSLPLFPSQLENPCYTFTVFLWHQ